MKTPLIKHVLASDGDGQNITVCGWVRTKRETKNYIFIQINDGSCLASLQLTYDRSQPLDEIEALLGRVSTGAAVKAGGKLIKSPASGQEVELSLESLFIFGEADQETYPLQKKKHSFEFLRENAHLRMRTNTFGAVARIRNQMALAIHTFLQERDFQYIHTPLITVNDCEGAGEMFQVTTLSLEKLMENGIKAGQSGVPPEKAAGMVDYSKDFFGKKTGLTVSGQLEVETFACALSRAYTFGPTFRAENSNTTRHLAEFWMCEPEIAFCDLEGNMELAEEFIKYLLDWALTKCAADMAFFDAHVQKGVIDMLTHVANSDFVRITYTEAVEILEKNSGAFEFNPYWGCHLQSEHEKYLTEQVYKKPVIVTDYPKDIKAFYMKQNPDGKTVRAMDILVQGLGEIIGGSQREENLGLLTARIRELGLNPEDYWWYLDLRKFGSVPHSGFGLGFDRLLLYITGLTNIRDVVPYPRAARLADF